MARRRRIVAPGGQVVNVGRPTATNHGAEEGQGDQEGQPRAAPGNSSLGALVNLIGRGARAAGHAAGIVQAPPIPAEGPVEVGREGEAYEGTLAVRSRGPEPPEDPTPPKRRGTGLGLFSAGKKPQQTPKPVRSTKIGKPANASWEARQIARQPPFLMYRNWPQAYQWYVDEGFSYDGHPNAFIVLGHRHGQKFAAGENLDALHKQYFEE